MNMMWKMGNARGLYINENDKIYTCIQLPGLSAETGDTTAHVYAFIFQVPVIMAMPNT